MDRINSRRNRLRRSGSALAIAVLLAAGAPVDILRWDVAGAALADNDGEGSEGGGNGGEGGGQGNGQGSEAGEGGAATGGVSQGSDGADQDDRPDKDKDKGKDKGAAAQSEEERAEQPTATAPAALGPSADVVIPRAEAARGGFDALRQVGPDLTRSEEEEVISKGWQ